MITVSSGVVAATLDTLRTCGGGRRECLVYWTASHGSDAVAAVVHPLHRASRGGVVVDGAWATRFFVVLAQEGMSAIAQVHSHPGAYVGHSLTDDEHALVSSAGYVSIVIPHFADSDSRSGWGVWQIDPDGAWVSAQRVIRWPA